MKSSSIIGYFDEVREGCAVGWAANNRNLKDRLQIEILCGQNIVGQGNADVFREDVFASRDGDGKYGFCIPISVGAVSAKRPLFAREANSKKKLIGKHPLPKGLTGNKAVPDNNLIAHPLDLFIRKCLRKLKRTFKIGPLLQGSIDVVLDGKIHGWIYDAKHPNQPLEVEVLSGDEIVAYGMADDFRKDLLDAKLGDGKHFFCLPLSHELFDGLPHKLRIREAITNERVDIPDYIFHPQPEHVKYVIEKLEKEMAINFLARCLEANPESQLVAKELDKFLLDDQSVEDEENLPGMDEIFECQRSQRLLDFFLSEIEKKSFDTGAKLPTNQEISLLIAGWEKQLTKLEDKKSLLQKKVQQVQQSRDEQVNRVAELENTLKVINQDREKLLASKKEFDRIQLDLQKEFDRIQLDNQKLNVDIERLNAELKKKNKQLDQFQVDNKELNIDVERLSNENVEQERRNKLLQEEFIKADLQIELIKEMLLNNKSI